MSPAVVCPSVGIRMSSCAPLADPSQAELVTPADCATASPHATSERQANDVPPPVYGRGRDEMEGERERRQTQLEALWHESSRDRQRHCRRTPTGITSAVNAYQSDRGTYFTGLQTCGHITCPVCGPAIREQERRRVFALVAAHLAAGGYAYTFLLTLSHGPMDRLGDLLNALDAGRSAAIGGDGGSRWARDRKRYGIAGTSWHREEMHGMNGWHPHVHGLLFVERELTPAELDALQSRIYGRHRAALEAKGYRAQAAFNGIQVVRSTESIAGYLTKQDRMAGRIAAEMTRGDLKKGKGLETPGSILHRFTLTGDVADLDLYRDYEQAMAGRHWRYVSSALLKRYGIDADGNPTEADVDAGLADGQDHKDAQDAVGGTLVMEIPVLAWRVITGRRGAVSQLRRLIHVGSLDAARQLVARALWESERRAVDRPNKHPTFGRRWGPYSPPARLPPECPRPAPQMPSQSA